MSTLDRVIGSSHKNKSINATLQLTYDIDDVRHFKKLYGRVQSFLCEKHNLNVTIDVNVTSTHVKFDISSYKNKYILLAADLLCNHLIEWFGSLRSGDIKTIEKLLKAKNLSHPIDVNCSAKDGVTPLMIAVGHGGFKSNKLQRIKANAQLAYILVKNGANKDLLDDKGYTAYSLVDDSETGLSNLVKPTDSSLWTKKPLPFAAASTHHANTNTTNGHTNGHTSNDKNTRLKIHPSLIEQAQSKSRKSIHGSNGNKKEMRRHSSPAKHVNETSTTSGSYNLHMSSPGNSSNSSASSNNSNSKIGDRKKSSKLSLKSTNSNSRLSVTNGKSSKSVLNKTKASKSKSKSKSNVLNDSKKVLFSKYDKKTNNNKRNDCENETETSNNDINDILSSIKEETNENENNKKDNNSNSNNKKDNNSGNSEIDNSSMNIIVSSVANAKMDHKTDSCQNNNNNTNNNNSSESDNNKGECNEKEDNNMLHIEHSHNRRESQLSEDSKLLLAVTQLNGLRFNGFDKSPQNCNNHNNNHSNDNKYASRRNYLNAKKPTTRSSRASYEIRRNKKSVSSKDSPLNIDNIIKKYSIPPESMANEAGIRSQSNPNIGIINHHNKVKNSNKNKMSKYDSNKLHPNSCYNTNNNNNNNIDNSNNPNENDSLRSNDTDFEEDISEESPSVISISQMSHTNNNNNNENIHNNNETIQKPVKSKSKLVSNDVNVHDSESRKSVSLSPDHSDNKEKETPNNNNNNNNNNITSHGTLTDLFTMSPSQLGLPQLTSDDKASVLERFRTPSLSLSMSEATQHIMGVPSNNSWKSSTSGKSTHSNSSSSSSIENEPEDDDDDDDAF